RDPGAATAAAAQDGRAWRLPAGDHPQLPLVDLDRRPPKPPPFSARPPEPGPHALGDEAPLELGDRGHDREYRLPEGVGPISGRVYRACPYRTLARVRSPPASVPVRRRRRRILRITDGSGCRWLTGVNRWTRLRHRRRYWRDSTSLAVCPVRSGRARRPLLPRSLLHARAGHGSRP